MTLLELQNAMAKLMSTVRVTNPIARTDPDTAISEMVRVCLKFPRGSIQTVIRDLQADPDAAWPTAGAMVAMLRDKTTTTTGDGPEDVWRNIWKRSIDTWSQHLAAAYAKSYPGANRTAIRFQGHKLALGKGAGVIGVKPHPAWDGERCLKEVDDFLGDR